MEKPTINGMYAVNYAHKKMIEKGLEPIFIGEKMNKHGENCACERCSTFEKHFDEFMEKANKEVELIAEVTQFMEDSVWEKDNKDSNDRTNFLNNTFKVLGYDYQKTIPDNVDIANTLHKIVNDKNFDTLKSPVVSDEKALAFYNENKQMIMQNIQNEARDFGYTEKELLNKIYEGQKCQDGNEIQKEIALARYAIFQVAENFESSIQYGISDESKSFAIRQFNKHYKNIEKIEKQNYLNNKMFELFNKSNKTGNETNEIKSLIEHGADVNAKDIQNYGKDIKSPLSYACGECFKTNNGNYGNLELVKFLISKGADVNTKDTNEHSPLTTATMYGNIEIVKYLIDKGADVNTKDKIGFTPLMATQYAIDKDKESVQIAKILIEHGADVNTKINNHTALTFHKNKVEKYQNKEMIKLLENAMEKAKANELKPKIYKKPKTKSNDFGMGM